MTSALSNINLNIPRKLWGFLNIPKITLLLFLLLASSCSSGTGSTTPTSSYTTVSEASSADSQGTGSNGSLALTVANSRKSESVSENALPDTLQVVSFRVVISGDDFSTIEVTFPGDAATGNIDGIPVGNDRKILVEALNRTGVVVRRREISHVTISGGQVTPIIASLLSVPVVTNVSEGNLITQSRLFFRGYAEPAGSLEIWDSYQGGTPQLIQDASVRASVISPALSDGGFRFTPNTLPLGAHTFTIRDPSSGEETRLSVTLVRPGRQPGVGIQNTGKLTTTQVQTVGRAKGFTDVLDTMTH